MIVYRDMAYCSRKDCANTECKRNLCNLDLDKLPDWMCYSVAEFNNCQRYKEATDENA